MRQVARPSTSSRAGRARARTPQAERTNETRQALLAAAVSSLVELGFARTTTLEVQKRSGLSRGALLHHFPTKAELLAATIVHLGEMRGRELKPVAAKLPRGAGRVDAVLELLWQSFTGPLFYVAMELRAAARTDVELRAALAATERVLHDRIIEQYTFLFGEEIAGKPKFGCALDMTLQLMIGAAMSLLMHGEQKSRVDLLIKQWKALFPTLLDPSHSTGGS
jgi:AcrR family transcriptional regulator